MKNKNEIKDKILIGLITATNEEYQSIYDIIKKTGILLFNSKDKTSSFPYFLSEFDFFENDKKYKINLITIKSGYGKLNAVSAATFLIERYKVDLLINFGACGSLTELNFDKSPKGLKTPSLKIGDFVIPKILYESSYLSFKINQENKDIKTNEENKDTKKEKSENGKIFVGLNRIESIIHKKIINKFDFVKEVKGCSSDMDVDSLEKRDFLRFFFGADICDWESFSIRKVAHLWKIPSLIFRVVSDYANESFLIDYKKNLINILDNGANFLLHEILPMTCKILISELNF